MAIPKQTQKADMKFVATQALRKWQKKSKLLDHVIKGSCDFMEGSSSMSATTLPGLGVGVVVKVGLSPSKKNYFVCINDSP